MIFVGNIAGIIVFVRFNSQSILQALGLAFRASMMSIFAQFISVLAAMFLLYFTNKHDPERLTYCYALSYSFGLILGIILVGGPLYQSYKKSKQDDESIELNEENHNEVQNRNNEEDYNEVKPSNNEEI